VNGFGGGALAAASAPSAGCSPSAMPSETRAVACAQLPVCAGSAQATRAGRASQMKGAEAEGGTGRW
jgi:hypothetical protein